jgi:flagellar motor protein MotB
MKYRHLLLLCATWLPMFVSAPVSAQSVSVSPIGETTERHLSEPLTPWAQDPQSLQHQAGDKLEVREVLTAEPQTVKLKNVVPPIRFDSGNAKIPPDYVEKIRAVLASMKDRKNVRLHFVGHADNQRLSEMLVRTYGDNSGLSRERAGEVAEFFKTALSLAPESISYEWAGDTKPVATNSTAAGRALNRRVEVEVWYDETKDRLQNQEVVVTEEIKRVKVCRIETVCKLHYQEGHARRARVKNLVAPLHYDDETINVTPEFTKQIEQALHNLRDKGNVQVKFIGYSDDAPLSGRNERIYGNALSLSKARAHRVALAIQEALKLPSAVILSDGRGAALPLASSESAQGRALNRRVEVEFWHDDPLQELPDEPQFCPLPNSDEMVSKAYEPPWGRIAPLSLEGGRAVIPEGYVDVLRRAMADVADKTRVRLRFVGYTKNERLDRRTAAVYGDDIGLSAARARRAMETIKEQMQLQDSQVEHEGRGYVQSPDVVNAGFIQGETSYVAVQVVYDELAPAENLDGIDITKLTRELRPKDPYGLNLMRITVDGQPLDDPGRSSADVQRCTDVALDKANVQFQFDNLRSSPRLGVTASPAVIAMRAVEPEANQVAATAEVEESQGEESATAEELALVEIESPAKEVAAAESSESAPNADAEKNSTAEELALAEIESPETAAPQAVTTGVEKQNFIGPPVRFQMYLNYSRFIDRAEVRIYDAEPTSVNHTAEAAPLAIVPLDTAGFAEWQPAVGRVGGPLRELKYAVRVYDKNGNFDETSAQSLWLVQENAKENSSSEKSPSGNSDDAASANVSLNANASGAELLASFGESALSVHNIQLGSGTVKVRGSGVPPEHTVWVAGRSAPVDANGNFTAEEILPNGAHTVEVAVLDQAGNGTVFLRDLEFKRDDWFYVGIADLTYSETRSSGPVQLLQGDKPRYDFDSPLDGRLAFFVNGKFSENWKLTASADTREGPVQDLFSNFMSKSPESLFRRIDPDYYYPTFGDDSVVEEMAPTMGKFFLRLSEHENYGQWGNFKVGYMANELAQVDRGLYGGNVHYGSDATTSFGEKRYMLDGFAAEPGTVPSREEFRGTGGSLYFLKRQDILVGSERLHIELRDKDSGIVSGVVNLRPGLDYDIDYLQGRVVLTEPLNSTANDNLLIRSSGLSGDEAHLVVRYEYSPGFDEIDALSTGGQGHIWLADRLKIGVTTNQNDNDGGDSSLNAADVTLRMGSDSWIKVQGGQSKGLVSNSLRSDDGGFGFTGPSPAAFVDASANAFRTDVSVGINDVFKNLKGRLSLYTQNLDAGYSAPGLNTLTDTEFSGGKLSMPITEKLNVTAKADKRVQQFGLETQAQEVDVGYEFLEHWSVSTGVRKDVRTDNSPVVPITQKQGERTDAVVQLGYDSNAAWRTYAFVQDTVSASEERDDNGRYGAGGAYRFNDRFKVDAEVSDGDLGAGGRLGTNYLVTPSTNLYLNYALENESTDNGLYSRRGNLVSGVKRRFSNSSSVYLEERYQDTNTLTGLTHATGVNLRLTDRWNIGANAEFGTLEDAFTGADTKRQAGGVSVGYGFETLQISSAVEYRADQTDQLLAGSSERTTWLFRNNFKYQLTPDWRLLGKFNHAKSESTLGDFYGGGYTEAVIGYGYRPVSNDRLNVLAKYTYFYNVPTTEQVASQNVAADFIQKSHVAALDLTYDLSRHWSVGGKYARRLAQVSLDRENPEFFNNNAQLFVLRTDWRFMPEWETLLEARLLDMPDLNERRSGYLAAIYRKLGKHLKAGAGYNFTEFSDDLTDLSFDHKGAFINVVGVL